MKCTRILFFMLGLSLGFPLAALEVLTETNIPLSYEENGVKKGLATEVVEAVLKKAGVTYSISMLPWCQAYKKTENTPSTLLYPTAMTNERIQKFKWVGPITPVFYSSFIGLKGDKIQLKELADAKKYKVGTVERDYNETFLLQNSFQTKNIVRFENNQQLISAIYKKEIDVALIQREVADAIAKILKKDPKQLFSYLIIYRQATEYYLAVNLKTPEETIQKLQEALDSIKASDAYNAIITSYGFSH